MRILVTGAAGQLGHELLELMHTKGLEVLGTDREEMDITDLGHCYEIIGGFRPQAVIHAAAYTAVDQAESHPEDAYRINSLGARNVALAAARSGAKCCMVSTDYVFDGRGTRPYREYDPTGPLTVYGQTKLAGEQMAAAVNTRTFIVRTAWLYGRHGNNFVKAMLKAGSGQQPVRVVDDQRGSPTNAADLARFLLELADTDYYGIYHAANGGECTWYEFAQAIFTERRLPAALLPCSTAEFPRPAPRPAYSVLDSMAIRANGLTPLRHWQEGLRAYLSDNDVIR